MIWAGVFKKRLRKNQYRCIILTKARHYWVYEYLFSRLNRIGPTLKVTS